MKCAIRVCSILCIFKVLYSKYRVFLQFLILNNILQPRVMVFIYLLFISFHFFAMFEANLTKHGISFKQQPRQQS